MYIHIHAHILQYICGILQFSFMITLHCYYIHLISDLARSNVLHICSALLFAAQENPKHTSIMTMRHNKLSCQSCERLFPANNASLYYTHQELYSSTIGHSFGLLHFIPQTSHTIPHKNPTFHFSNMYLCLSRDRTKLKSAWGSKLLYRSTLDREQ